MTKQRCRNIAAWRIARTGLLGVGMAVFCLGCRMPPGLGPSAPEAVTLPSPETVWPPRAVWVVRQPYASPEEIAAVMDRCAEAKLNTVLFQVRGNGTVFYRSNLEPWAEEYHYTDPGFDPLEVACREAHRRGLALHAWVNVMPAWRGRQPPSNVRQLYHTHPDWFLYDQHGQRQPLSDFYVSLNPTLPEVRAYLVSVFEDLAARYPIDGLHLDYIRFPIETAPAGSDYPRDAATLRLYRALTGKNPDDDPAGWTRWRREQVTRLVGDIRRMLRRVKPAARLTAACAPDVARARARYFQDGPAWLKRGLVDAVFVMNYTDDLALFRKRQEDWQRLVPGRMVVPGLGVYKHAAARTSIAQLELAGQWGHGFSLFSYTALLDTYDDGTPRLDALQPALASLAPRTGDRRSVAHAGK